MEHSRETTTDTGIKLADIDIIQLLGKGKSGYSYLAGLQHRQVVLKTMHNEQVSYYTFAKPKVELELDSYRILKDSGIKIPVIIGYSLEEQFIVKEYIHGTTVSEILKNQAVSENLLFEMLSWERQLKEKQINIDYFPSNFVVSNDQVFYVDYEHNPYSEEYNFRNWGIYYWINQQGFAAFLESGDASHINQPGTGKPLATESLKSQRNNILEIYNRREKAHR